MGRVAKYKKIKSFDPYSKKNGGKIDLGNVGIWGLSDNGRKVKKRSKRAEMLRSKKKRRVSDNDGFDLPPSERDEFDINDLVGSIKKQEMSKTLKDEPYSVNRVAVNGNVATIPQSDSDERKAARMLNVKEQVKKEAEKKQAVTHTRMEGESKRAYAKRTKVETRQIIQRSADVNIEKKQKKKDFLNNKKKNKKKSSNKWVASDDFNAVDDEETGTLITGERAVAMMDEPIFGEQAERPPIFRQLPRGAKVKASGDKDAKKKGMTDEQVEAEKHAMEMMRRRVQAQYAAIKIKRRRAGDFHL